MISHTKKSLYFCYIFFSLFFMVSVMSQNNDYLIGQWHFKNEEMEVVADFFRDGTFKQVTVSQEGKESYAGRYQLMGNVLYLMPQGQEPLQFVLSAVDSDTMSLYSPSTEVSFEMKRIKTKTSNGNVGRTEPPVDNKKSLPASERPSATAKAEPRKTSQDVKTSNATKKVPILMRRTWEPNEKAFTFLLPQGWKFQGGIFNVNPLRTNGPGNSIAPKCDLIVKNDERGTVMIRFLPSWNYADLSYSPTGFGLFAPGSYYQGMLVKVMPTPRQFLQELLQNMHPQMRDLKIVAEDPIREVTEAYVKQSAAVNQQLQMMGLQPNTFDSLAISVEYNENGTRFRECLATTIADSRAGAFMWSNNSTIVCRAPVDEFEKWKALLDTIRLSIQLNPQWISAVMKAMGERAKTALETQRYINKVMNEIVENRRRTNAEIRHEQWLLISGNEEYKNPFTGETELDTSYYQHRWCNNQGDILYTDENSFDPNKIEEYNTREWKRTPVRER